MSASLVIVGAGPRGTGLLERIAANAAELLPTEQKLTIHLVDPHPPGAGRVWRYEQSPLLRMNSMAEDVTMFTDVSSTIEGPVSPGPSLAAWAARVRDGAEPLPDDLAPDVLAELRSLAPTDFPTRRLQSAYLSWVFRTARDRLPAHVSVRVHADTAVALSGEPDGPQQVHLASGRTLTGDLVVLTLGHLDALSEQEEHAMSAFADRHGLRYLPPAYSADIEPELDAIAPGEHVVLRGFGLAFIDLMVMLTEGRDGRYRTEPDGSLTYLPSGREPVLHVGSRRGVPYHAKTGYRLRGPIPPLPRFLDPAAVDALLAPPRTLDFRADVWPLIAKEIAYGYYHELFHGRPERTALPWGDFLTAYTPLSWYTPELDDLVARAVPDPADRIDFEAIDRPLAGLTFTSPLHLRDRLHHYVRDDLARRAAADAPHTADLGAFFALLSVYGQLPRVAASERLGARSLARDLDGWWRGFFSFIASGPPGHRLGELLALSDAGLVHFLGPNLSVTTDNSGGRFLASSPAVPGAVTEATTFIEARLPGASLHGTGSPLLRALHQAGEVVEEVRADTSHGLPPYLHRSGLVRIRPEDGALLDADGSPHPRRLALGAPTNARAVAAFARPHTNAPAFRQNDATARVLLTALAAGTAVGGAADSGARSAVPWLHGVAS